MVKPISLDGCERCPACHDVPVAKQIKDFEGKDAWELVCEKLGHRYTAMGKTLEQAVEHFNIYVKFVRDTRGA